MATSLQSFRIGLYEEHLAEASFLYEQRRALMAQADIPWLALDGFEQRLEAHVDALIVGGELALVVSRQRAVAGDAGELFVAVCVFCRHGQAPLLSEVLQHLDVGDPERVRAVADALKYELPAAWEEFCLRGLGHAKIELAVLLAEVAGYRRLRTGRALATTLERAPEGLKPAVFQAIGRSADADLQASVRPYFRSSDVRLRSAALRAGLRLQDQDAVRALYEQAADGSAPDTESGLAGGRFMAAPLVAHVKASPPDIAAIRALALLGDLSAVRSLAGLLAVPDATTHASQALYVITGARLFESALVPDEIGEDEMFDKELRTLRETGEKPKRSDGEPFGSRVERVSTDPARWEQWLSENARRFNGERRYRCGLPASPRVALNCLMDAAFPAAFRGLVMEELLIRHAIDLRIEPDMPVRRQLSILEAAANGIAQMESAVEAGRWYAQGQVLTR